MSAAGASIDPISVTIEASPPLDRPAIEVIGEYFSEVDNLLQTIVPETLEEQAALSRIVRLDSQLQSDFQILNSNSAPEVRQGLVDIASAIKLQNSRAIVIS
ncbi:MAG: hypothetical protein U0175_32870 [Caldilineaceae bacterium]